MNMKFWKHFKTITYHRWLVMKGCFKVGLYKQGLLHDLSKYSLTEFIPGVKYYQGTRSPNDAEREVLGYSLAWMHHKGRNKHHYDYWIDYSPKNSSGGMLPVPMPKKYITEMFMDRIAASKVYQGKAYTDDAPLKYFMGRADAVAMHPYTKENLLMLLQMLSKEGEKSTFAYIKKDFLK